MKKTILVLVTLLTVLVSNAQEISGTWSGILKVQSTEMRLVFHITNSNGEFKATMDSPDQNVKGIPVTSTTFINNNVTLKVANAGITYSGNLIDNNNIDGNFTQGGQSFKMPLKRGEIKKNEAVRPQEPIPPFDYYTEEISFRNPVDNINLRGTLSLPDNNGVHPTVIIISGSGPQNRDGLMFNHKPYLLIADYLTKKGIGVLRFDERGVGDSEGTFSDSDINTFSSDIEAAIKYLKNRDGVDISNIGLVGHSIGGIIAPKVASQNKDVAFIVLLAAPGIPGDEVMLSQKAALERIMGINEMQIAQGQALMKQAYDIIKSTELDNKVLKDSINTYYKEKYGNLFPENQRKQITNQITTYEVASFIKTDPRKYLTKVNCPVLVLNGTKDFQVEAESNLSAIKNSLEKGGNFNFKVKSLDNLNHLFQECETGSIEEYGKIEQTIYPEVLNIISDWITNTINK